MIMTELEPVPAATVAVVRENPQQQLLEVLLLQRNVDLAFMGGHWVFPGGRVEQHDYDGELNLHQAACQAAVRETQEETGLILDPGSLVHIAHWTTPPNLVRRFSTWFFVCPLYSHASPHVDVRSEIGGLVGETNAQTPVTIDNSEILDFRWLAPPRALAAAEQGDLVIAQPTRATLATFAGHATLDDLMSSVTGGNIHVYPDNSPYYQPADK